MKSENSNMIHSFLLIGQSNMAGRGFLQEAPVILNEHIKVLRNGRWQYMLEPLHNDRSFAGIGLAASFAAAWQAKNNTEEIGLIPCADGGTSLDDWAVGGALFDHAVAQAKLAMRSSTLAGILWHQGENDSTEASAMLYTKKFEKIMDALRLELQAPEVPLLIGELGSFLTMGAYGAYFSGYERVNEQLLNYAKKHSNSYFITAQNLSANEDQIHFNSRSLRQFGIRYFKALDQKKHILSPIPEEESILAAIYAKALTSNERKILLQHKLAMGDISLAEYTSQQEG